MSDMIREYSPKEMKILDAAAALISENDAALGSLKVADIALKAGIGKGTVYEYFSSKEEILQEAVFRYVINSIESQWEDAIAKGTFKECIYAIAEGMFCRDDGICVWDMQLLLSQDRNFAEAVFARIHSFCSQRMMEMCRILMARGVEEGLFPRKNEEEVAQCFIHFCGGLNLMMRLGKKEDRSKYMDRGYAMLLRSLQEQEK